MLNNLLAGEGSVERKIVLDLVGLSFWRPGIMAASNDPELISIDSGKLNPA